MSVKYFGSDALNKLIDLVKTALGLKADDSNVVHKTGNETVAGEKSFSDRATVQKTNSDTPLLLKGSSDTSWIAFATASGGISNPMGYIGVKSDNKPYFYSGGAKRLALLSETLPVFGSNDVSSNDCNTWTAKGVYQGLDVTNSPVTGWITVITIPVGNEAVNYCEQRLFVSASNDVYSRYRMNGTWDSWKKTLTVPQYVDVTLNLSTATWNQSSTASDGIYYASWSISGINQSYGVNITTPLAVSLTSWRGLRKTDVVQPLLSNNEITVMSNVNSFAPTSSYSNVTVRILYI